MIDLPTFLVGVCVGAISATLAWLAIGWHEQRGK
jgi:hypothetical protein